MKRYILICVCALTVVASITFSIYACCVDPTACFEFTPSDARCFGTTITFDATDSYDLDEFGVITIVCDGTAWWIISRSMDLL